MLAGAVIVALYMIISAEMQKSRYAAMTPAERQVADRQASEAANRRASEQGRNSEGEDESPLDFFLGSLCLLALIAVPIAVLFGWVANETPPKVDSDGRDAAQMIAMVRGSKRGRS
jgi:hypothetical protein